jgi:uncharacterized protein YgbK (DUF1537 family)
MQSLEAQMLDTLSAGKSMVIYTAKGPDDHHLAAVLDQLPTNVSAPAHIANRIGLLYARLAHTAMAKAGLTRLVVAGGDSSSFTMRQLGAVALEIKASHFKQIAVKLTFTARKVSFKARVLLQSISNQIQLSIHQDKFPKFLLSKDGNKCSAGKFM